MDGYAELSDKTFLDVIQKMGMPFFVSQIKTEDVTETYYRFTVKGAVIGLSISRTVGNAMVRKNFVAENLVRSKAVCGVPAMPEPESFRVNGRRQLTDEELEHQLEEALQDEDFERCAEIRDELNRRKA